MPEDGRLAWLCWSTLFLDRVRQVQTNVRQTVSRAGRMEMVYEVFACVDVDWDNFEERRSGQRTEGAFL